MGSRFKIEPAFVYVTLLFFVWGFVTVTIDPLITAVRSVFHLSYAQSMLMQSAFFVAYGVVSLPAAKIVARIGYAASIITALGLMVAGCLVMPLATAFRTYPLVLLALFIIASGVTLLQVAANPLAANLGRTEDSHFRLTFSQAFNSLGTWLAPRVIGANLLLRGAAFTGKSAMSEAGRAESLHNIDLAFFAIAAVIGVMAAFIWAVRGRITRMAPAVATGVSPFSAFRSTWALFGAMAIFLYVGSEVSIGSVMISFLGQPTTLGVTAQRGAYLLSYYWGGAMVGRFLGSALLTRIKAGPLLTGAALVAAGLCLTVNQTSGLTPAIAALSIGLFNSIMFPTIFSLTLERSSAPVSATSGLLCMAIVGGAALPPIVGLTADSQGLGEAFLVPMAAYMGVATFALVASCLKATVETAAVPQVGH